MKAVHFGAGNIGRGFVGLLLHDAGYEVVFADVNAELIDQLDAAPSYDVHEVGEGGQIRTVTGFRAINSASAENELISEIQTADVVTTAVGPNILRFVAPVIARALALRDSGLAPLAVMACENAINATDVLKTEVQASVAPDEWEALSPRAIFANTAVDRIVPGQAASAGIDVTVETFYEWVIESGPFGENTPDIPGATFVDALGPYIERKLFTVNTGHATAAYYGFAAGIEKISDALADTAVSDAVRSVLEETSALLVAKHGIDAEAQAAYREKILGRFANPHLPDTVQRVGRQPLRKLSRHERFIGPAAELAERGMGHSALLDAIAQALRFDVADDEQSAEMRRMLAELDAPAFVEQVTGLAPEHPLFGEIVGIVSTALA
ncbi:mannitol-1-phosphate 5-dehydrogenase [Mycetocola manganoxydans]|uniref:Mannitol-1-phosphate 5-dehydrogenase n=1 Tax=Mycetocola manganoxydans TaxID=699879 RepID=A0A3L6ZWD4_9MICO|nr:mannitol-1-phosphate 5-dehydrogenase [Mycetocola manganoxydans]RLP72005.1 mannitol-1-phosphate 5-dehydrogenase [Mycetocola manganoxydans]GHD47502.1 mannitol-1-phosphate 5-dehydrogenase [Mycetocola manganoxydans]